MVTDRTIGEIPPRRGRLFVLARRALHALTQDRTRAKTATLPGHAAAALTWSTDSAATLNEGMGLLERDPALAASAMRAASSAYFAAGRERPRDLRGVALRLGLDRMKQVVQQAVAEAYVFRAREAAAAARLFAHSRAVGHACVAVARLAPRPSFSVPWEDPGLRSQAFLAGLFHDVGRIFAVAYLADEGVRLEPEEALRFADVVHADAGAAFARSYRLPETVVEAVERHHGTVPSWGPGRRPVWHAGHLVAVAEGLLRTASGPGADVFTPEVVDAWPDPWPTVFDGPEAAVRLWSAIRLVAGGAERAPSGCRHAWAA